jgi:hypothetical protein
MMLGLVSKTISPATKSTTTIMNTRMYLNREFCRELRRRL